MEIIIDTKKDEPVLCKLDAHGTFKTYNPEFYRIVSEKEYQRLLDNQKPPQFDSEDM